jgi:hypothetical protein
MLSEQQRGNQEETTTQQAATHSGEPSKSEGDLDAVAGRISKTLAQAETGGLVAGEARLPWGMARVTPTQTGPRARDLSADE